MTVYIDARPDAAENHPAYFDQACAIVAAVPDTTDPHPTNDWYRIRFDDGTEFTVAPEELSPIPAAGAHRHD